MPDRSMPAIMIAAPISVMLFMIVFMLCRLPVEPVTAAEQYSPPVSYADGSDILSLASRSSQYAEQIQPPAPAHEKLVRND